MKKIKSGVYGLNPLLGGGINENSTTVVIGAAGAGKTTFAIQFIMRGLEIGDEGVFISLDENKNQIIREAIEMGFDKINDYIDQDKLVFIDASGKQFTNFILKELPDIVKDWKGVRSRIVVDPLTPVIWAVKERYEQRELLTFLFKETRNVGTVLCTLEEHGHTGDLSGPETIIPMYLADSVIHLQFKPTDDGGVLRQLRIVKCRHSKHSHLIHPYKIIGGFGITIQRTQVKRPLTRNVPEKIKNAVLGKASAFPLDVRRRIMKACERLTDEDFEEISPTALINDVLREYQERPETEIVRRVAGVRPKPKAQKVGKVALRRK